MLKQLFRSRKKDDLGDLIRCIEKITKVIKLSIGEEDRRIVSDNLKWLENFFYSLFDLRKTDYKKFISLIDPDSRYKNVEVDMNFWRNIDFSQNKVLPAQEGVNEKEFTRPLYNSVPDETYYERDIVVVISSCVYKIWEIGYKKNELDTCRSCILILANWVNHLDKIQDDKNLSYRVLLDNMIQILKSIHVAQAKNRNPDRYFLTHYTSFLVWLNLVFKENTDLSNTDHYFAQVFFNIQFALSQGNDKVFLDFIKHCTHSTYDHFRIVNDTITLTTKYRKNLTVVRELYDIQRHAINIYTRKQREDVLKLIKDKLEKSHEFENSDLDAINTYLLKALKYNQLRLQVFKLSTYLLFKRNYDTLLSAFDFNQPNDSSAIWSNRDMFPTTFYEALVLIKNKGVLEDELRFGFEDHHGAEIYIRQLLLILLYRNIKRSQSIIADFVAFVNEHQSSDELENFKFHFNEVVKAVLPRGKFNFSEDRIDNVQSLTKQVEEIFKERFEAIKRSLSIEEDTKISYCSNVCKAYLQNAYFKHLIEFFGEKQTEQIAKWEGVEYGINQLIPREAFIDWHVPYYGLSEGSGRLLSENENIIIANNLSSKSQKEYIDEARLADRLSGLKDEYLIIGFNMFFDSLLMQSENYSRKWDDNKYVGTPLERYYMGMYGKADIFNYYTGNIGSKIYLLKRDVIKSIKRYYIPDDRYIKDEACDYLFFTFLDLNNEEDFAKYKASLPNNIQESANSDQKRFVNFKAIHFFEIVFSEGFSMTELILNSI